MPYAIALRERTPAHVRVPVYKILKVYENATLEEVQRELVLKALDLNVDIKRLIIVYGD